MPKPASRDLHTRTSLQSCGLALARRCYCHLRQTARQVQYVRSLIVNAIVEAPTIDLKSYYNDAGQRMEQILISHALVVWDKQEYKQSWKTICCKCGINMSSKCKRCPMCSCRYCSVACQKADWKVHKKTCSGHRVIQHSGLPEMDAKFQSDEDSDTD